MVASENCISVEENRGPESRRREGPVAPRADCTVCTETKDGVPEDYLTRLGALKNAALLQLPRRIVYATRIPPRPNRRSAIAWLGIEMVVSVRSSGFHISYNSEIAMCAFRLF